MARLLSRAASHSLPRAPSRRALVFRSHHWGHHLAQRMTKKGRCYWFRSPTAHGFNFREIKAEMCSCKHKLRVQSLLPKKFIWEFHPGRGRHGAIGMKFKKKPKADGNFQWRWNLEQMFIQEDKCCNKCPFICKRFRLAITLHIYILKAQSSFLRTYWLTMFPSFFINDSS